MTNRQPPIALNADQRATNERMVSAALNRAILAMQVGAKGAQPRAAVVADLMDVQERLRKLGFTV